MIRSLVSRLLRFIFRVRVRGTLGRHEKLLIVANHQSLLDGILLGASLPVQPVWVLHTEVAAHWWVRLPMRFLPHLVVDSTHPMAMKSVIALVESGRPVLIFPEGRVTTTGSMMKIYEGPAFVAAKTGATVVPVHIDGAIYTYFSRARTGYPRKLRPRITITILPPRTITAPEGVPSRARHRMGAEALRKIMQEAAFASYEKTTLFPALLDSISLYGRRRRVLRDIQKEVTFGQILKGSLALGRLVAKLSREGETVGVLMPNVAATVSLLYGMFAMRRVPALLNYTAGHETIRSTCRAAGLRTVITSRAFLEKMRLTGLPGKLDGVKVVCLEDLRSQFRLTDKLWLMCWALWFPRAAARRARPEEPAVIVFTSGSEGKPKGVALSHDNFISNLAQIRAVIEFTPADKLLSALPMFHTFGLTVGIFLPFSRGCSVLLYTSPLHYRVIPELIYSYDCTVLFSSSTFLGNYARHANPFDFRSLRLVVAGAEKLSDDVRKLYFEKFGIRIHEGYGVTETSPVLSVNTPMAFKTGTVGELFPGLEYRIEPVPGIAKGGLLHVRGPNVMLGYISEEQPGVIQPTRSIFGEGWHNTGDIAEVDEEGFITIHGRVRRFAKVAGEMVSLDQVERVARAASPQAAHASTAVAEPGRGEVIILFTDDRTLRRERLLEAARAIGAPELAVPRRIIMLDEIPQLGSGKTDYVTLNRLARELQSSQTVAS
ncbi:MAG TPA: AMP-binding protein [Bryobacteraceae bacterium]|nr:AMP-binding protein [Bryobacteraceae bacterium]HOL70946.1 AMP-binding protein [Bryobacteraceae bacterium]HOQ45679.1 AMP-binding protein [Bryobacteraceae bacterium]HPU71595.1 AMP-binding protein [Bryobacteraceae bacterium]